VVEALCCGSRVSADLEGSGENDGRRGRLARLGHGMAKGIGIESGSGPTAQLHWGDQASG
jgi:hypothetical protein